MIGDATVGNAVQTVLGLYNELFLFDRELTSHLREGTPSLESLSRKLMYPPRDRSEMAAQKIVRRQMGRVYALADLVDDEEEEEPDRAEEDAEDDGDEGDGKGDVELAGGEGWIFIKII